MRYVSDILGDWDKGFGSDIFLFGVLRNVGSWGFLG